MKDETPQDDIKWGIQLATLLDSYFQKGDFKTVDKMITVLDFTDLNESQICVWCRFAGQSRDDLKEFNYLLEQSIIRLKYLKSDVESILHGLI